MVRLGPEQGLSAGLCLGGLLVGLRRPCWWLVVQFLVSVLGSWGCVGAVLGCLCQVTARFVPGKQV